MNIRRIISYIFYYFVIRHYFALQTNPGEQFFMFVSLASWLIKKCGKYIDTPQEYDDPNSTIAVILDIAHSLVI